MEKQALLKQIVREGNSGAISITTKVTKRCNIRPACKYCYDYDARCDNRTHDMTLDTLEQLVRKSVGSGDFNRVIFVWHGGEPLVMGRAFFEQALRLQERYNLNGNVRVENRIQTNAVGLDQDWVRFLKANRFHMETSFDAFDNDAMRGRTEEVLCNILQAKEAGYEPGNVMFIVTRRNVNRLREAYDYFNSIDLHFTPSPLVSLGQACQHDELTITPEEYGRALVDLMNYMLAQKESRIRVRFIDAVLRAVLFGEQKLCSHGYCVYDFVAVEHSGAIFPCAKVNDPDWDFGNIHKHDRLSSVFQTEAYRRYSRECHARVSECASDNNGEPCEVFRYCKGGCASNAKSAGGYTKRDFYCTTYRMVFKRAMAVRDGLEKRGHTFPVSSACEERLCA